MRSSSPHRREPATDFGWSPADFRRVQALIQRRAGICLHDGKRSMVYSRLTRRLRITGHRSFSDYLSALENGDEAEAQEFVNALTTNLTAFFREPHHFELLAQHLRQHPDHGPWRIWCNAASTGEEAYSIAMTVHETLGPSAAVEVLATDIDSRVLDLAARGVYRAEASARLGSARLQRFFMRGRGTNEGLVQVKPALVRMVHFSQLNLVEERWGLRPDFDVVFCRNVMIYFDAATRRRLLERLHAHMRPDGLLCVGHAENLNDARDLFTPAGRTAHRRR